MKKVAVIMGSDSDWPVVKGACQQLAAFGIPYEAHILSAHRTPAEAAEFAKNARDRGFGAIICAAGMAAHLAGAIAANTVLPVIGIPVKASTLDGLDALLSTVQMPAGIPVATVAIDISGRSYCNMNLNFKNEKIGDMTSDIVVHFFESFASSAKLNIYGEVQGVNDHHKCEAIFKAFAKALKDAIKVEHDQVPSTKGII